MYWKWHNERTKFCYLFSIVNTSQNTMWKIVRVLKLVIGVYQFHNLFSFICIFYNIKIRFLCCLLLAIVGTQSEIMIVLMRTIFCRYLCILCNKFNESNCVECKKVFFFDFNSVWCILGAEQILKGETDVVKWLFGGNEISFWRKIRYSWKFHKVWSEESCFAIPKRGVKRWKFHHTSIQRTYSLQLTFI